MPRRFRSIALAAPMVLLALGLVSCFHDVTDCPTCPAVDGGRIDILIPQGSTVDSLHVTIDNGSRVTVRNGRRHSFLNLTEGSREVRVTRFYSVDDVFTTKTTTLVIVLARGETKTIVFHNDYPLITWAPAPGAGRLQPSPPVG